MRPRLSSRAALVLLCAVLLGTAAWLVHTDFAPVKSAEEWVEGVVDPDPTIIRSPRGGAVSVTRKGKAVVWAVGDGNAGQDSAALAQHMQQARPDLFLYLGDVYPRGTPADFADNYASTYGRLAGLTAPTPGNHDWAEASEGYYPYWHKATGKPLPTFYELRLAGWDILALNSEAPHDEDSAQLRWLHGQLRGGGDCRIAFWHRPRFSAGTVHGDQPDVTPLWRALAGHARIVVNGHEHDSQRFLQVGGITEFVAGAGGAGLYPLNRDDDRLAFGDAGHYAALRFELRPGVARFAFVTAAGRIMDHGSVRCGRQGRDT